MSAQHPSAQTQDFSHRLEAPKGLASAAPSHQMMPLPPARPSTRFCEIQYLPRSWSATPASSRGHIPAEPEQGSLPAAGVSPHSTEARPTPIARNPEPSPPGTTIPADQRSSIAHPTEPSPIVHSPDPVPPSPAPQPVSREPV